MKAEIVKISDVKVNPNNLASTAAMCIPIPNVMGEEQRYEPLFNEDQREDIKTKILIPIRDLNK